MIKGLAEFQKLLGDYLELNNDPKIYYSKERVELPEYAAEFKNYLSEINSIELDKPEDSIDELLILACAKHIGMDLGHFIKCVEDIDELKSLIISATGMFPVRDDWINNFNIGCFNGKPELVNKLYNSFLLNKFKNEFDKIEKHYLNWIKASKPDWAVKRQANLELLKKKHHEYFK